MHSLPICSVVVDELDSVDSVVIGVVTVNEEVCEYELEEPVVGVEKSRDPDRSAAATTETPRKSLQTITGHDLPLEQEKANRVRKVCRVKLAY